MSRPDFEATRKLWQDGASLAVRRYVAMLHRMCSCHAYFDVEDAKVNKHESNGTVVDGIRRHCTIERVSRESFLDEDAGTLPPSQAIRRNSLRFFMNAVPDPI